MALGRGVAMMGAAGPERVQRIVFLTDGAVDDDVPT